MKRGFTLLEIMLTLVLFAVGVVGIAGLFSYTLEGSSDAEYTEIATMLAPLARRIAPRTLDELLGQEHILGPGKILRRAIEADRITSLILSGPPGSGKTALARIIAMRTQATFENVNAVKAASRADPQTLEISADTKAKVAIGDYSRGGKKPDRL